MSDLTKSIQNLYKGEISQGEAEIAKNNLVGFFRALRARRKSNFPKNSVSENLVWKF
jgi:hypothetical protein